MQQNHQQFKMVAGFGHLFRPSSDRASLKIKENPQNRHNLKLGTHLYTYVIILLLCVPPPFFFTLERFCWFSLISNDARSDDGLRRKSKLVAIVSY